jgi:hypothetical protein
LHPGQVSVYLRALFEPARCAHASIKRLQYQGEFRHGGSKKKNFAQQAQYAALPRCAETYGECRMFQLR